jgi:hypothetical protein
VKGGQGPIGVAGHIGQGGRMVRIPFFSAHGLSYNRMTMYVVLEKQ